MSRSLSRNTLAKTEFLQGGAMTYPASMGFKKAVLATCAVSALMFAGTAQAQTAAAAAESQAELEEIVVTGSRIVRSGYSAPTPLAVLAPEALRDRASANVADLVNTMPVFSGSSTPSSTAGSVSAGTGGVNALNLRGLGVNRTLVLIDGQRSVGAFLSGAVDVNTIPQQLIERVEVVTGGASAVYGSDAVGGVVNFILDKTFTGVAGEVSGGMTSYEDDKTLQLSLTAGTPFASGRGHLTLSGSYVDKEGINYGSGDRDWGRRGYSILRNPGYTATSGNPLLLLRDQTALADATRGGLILTGPLRGTAFGPSGTPYQYTFGPLSDGRMMQGGDWATNDIRPEEGTSLSPSEQRANLFGRVSYELTDNINVFAQGIWSKSETFNNSSPTFNLGNLTNVRIDNPFLPEAIRARGVAAGVTTFTMGSLNYDLPNIEAVNERTITRFVVGIDGRLDLFGQDWRWDAYFQTGKSVNLLSSAGQTIINNYNLARDATRHPTTGQIVCRSTLTAPTNGCLPYNMFGVGVNSAATVDYLTDTSFLEQTLKQDVWAASITGEPFSIWAGPVSMAFNAEHRKESVDGVNDPLSTPRAYRAGNYQISTGKISVSEASAEAVVPLAKDLPLAYAWDLQLAGRLTDYSLSGRVETWKLGTTYKPNPDITFRGALSRDIRAPNLQEILQGPTGGSSGVFDPLTGLQFAPFGVAVGNPALTPEIAKNYGLGVVVQPSFLPGFGASVDYWRIDVDDAISSLDSQATIDLCFRGGPDSQKYCAAITRGANNAVISVIRTNFNQAFARTRGIDFEASYRLPLDTFNSGWAGSLSLRALGTHYLEAYGESGLLNEKPTDVAGENATAGPPRWRYSATLSYDNDPLRLSLTGRGVSSGVYSNSYVECSSGCPASTVDNQTIDNNRIPGALYFDVSANYKLLIGGTREVELFATVRNLFNKDPAVAAKLSSATAWYNRDANAALYDVLGRVYRVGVRFRM
jgi:iron complex outermembrane receptor protein